MGGSHGHSHGDGLDDAFDPDLRRRLTLIVAVVALATLVATLRRLQRPAGTGAVDIPVDADGA